MYIESINFAELSIMQIICSGRKVSIWFVHGKSAILTQGNHHGRPTDSGTIMFLSCVTFSFGNVSVMQETTWPRIGRPFQEALYHRRILPRDYNEPYWPPTGQGETMDC